MWTTNIFDKNVIAHEYVIDHLHISDFDSKVFYELCPFKEGKWVPFHAKFDENTDLPTDPLLQVTPAKTPYHPPPIMTRGGHRHLFHSKNICPLLFLTSR